MAVQDSMFALTSPPAPKSAPLFQGGPRGILHMFLFHAHRPCLEKLSLCLEVPKSPNGHLKPFLDPGGGFIF